MNDVELNKQAYTGGKVDPVAIIGPNYSKLSPMMQKFLRGTIRDFYRLKKGSLVMDSLNQRHIRKINQIGRELLRGISKMVNPKRPIKHAKPSLREFDNVDMSAMDIVTRSLSDMTDLAFRMIDLPGKKTEKQSRVINKPRMADRIPASIKVLRRKLGVTQEELGRMLRISATTVRRWEQGESWPSSNTLAKLHHLMRHGAKLGR